MKRLCGLIVAMMGWALLHASPINHLDSQKWELTLSNPNRQAVLDAPVCLAVPSYQDQDGAVCRFTSATVEIKGKEIPCQMDDLDGDGLMDELSFVVDIAKKGSVKAVITYFSSGSPKEYPARVHAQMWFKDNDKKRSYTEKQHIPTDTVSERVDNMYSKMMHHGPAFENERVAYRVYFDKKESTDVYGKRVPQLELADGLWYSSEVPALVNDRHFGDDIILVGQTISMGTLRGWDDGKDDPAFATSPAKSKVPDPCMVMIDPFDYRQAHIVAKGPVRTVVDMNVEGWQYKGHKLNLKSRYILYAGNRECEVKQYLSSPDEPDLDLSKLEFVTGVMKVGSLNSDSVDVAMQQYIYDGKGFCASYGKDWPDPNHTLFPYMSKAALALEIPEANVVRTLDRREQILYGVRLNEDGSILYRAACAAPDLETFAPYDDGRWNYKRWFEWSQQWNEHKAAVVTVK